MADSSRNDASMLLGMAFGVAHMCCGASEELDREDADLTDIVRGLRHITTLVGEAEKLIAASPVPVESVGRALAVCTLATTDIAVEFEGRYRQHWNDEITAWSLHALCDVIERAKAAVDGLAAPADLAEVTHG